MAEDRSGRVVAMANHDYAYVATPERTIRVGPLDDCRGVAVSPDGQWLATGSHAGRRSPGLAHHAMARRWPSWRSMGAPAVSFSPDGKWLVTGKSTPAGSGKSAPGARCGRSAASVAAFPPTAG